MCFLSAVYFEGVIVKTLRNWTHCLQMCTLITSCMIGSMVLKKIQWQPVLYYHYSVISAPVIVVTNSLKSVYLLHRRMLDVCDTPGYDSETARGTPRKTSRVKHLEKTFFFLISKV